MTATFTEVPNSEGPVNGGASCSFMVQEAARTAASPRATSLIDAFIYRSGWL